MNTNATIEMIDGDFRTTDNQDNCMSYYCSIIQAYKSCNFPTPRAQIVGQRWDIFYIGLEERKS